MNFRTGFVLLTMVVATRACTELDLTAGDSPGTRVEMLMALSGLHTPITGTVDAGLVDSIWVDSALIVFSWVKFENHTSDDPDDVDIVEGPNSAYSKQEDGDSDEHDDGMGSRNVFIRGPLGVIVRDTILINIGSGVLPPGLYSTIKMKIHRLTAWDDHESAGRIGGRVTGLESMLASTGSSIMAWGSMSKDGVWQSFVFTFDGNFHVRRHASVLATNATTVVPVAFRVDVRQWFVDPRTGMLLDPHDASLQTRNAFRHAIHLSMYTGNIDHEE